MTIGVQYFNIRYSLFDIYTKKILNKQYSMFNYQREQIEHGALIVEY